MLASHNTLTYLRPRRSIMRLFAWLWRCQVKSLPDQIRAGIRYADIRVRYDDGALIPCHGCVDLRGCVFDAMVELDRARIPYRLILERGDNYDAARLAHDIRQWRARGEHPMLHEAYRKDGWRRIAEALPSAVPLYPVADRYYKPVDSALPWWRNAWHAVTHPSTIARYASRIDLRTLRADKRTIYLVDRL